MYTEKQMAKIIADMICDGQVVNLGIGMPTKIADELENRPVMIHSENGLLGMGRYPYEHEVNPQIINAGKETVTIKTGGSTFDSALSFAMIRGGHIDVAVLGAMEVSCMGDLANWQIPGKKVTGMGGAMDLVASAKHIIVAMQHVNKAGESKLLKKCSLPITGLGCVKKVVTELGVFDITEQGFVLLEYAPGVSIEYIQSKTEGRLSISESVFEMTL